MPDLLVAVLMIAVTYLATRRLITVLRPPRRVLPAEPPRQIDMQRLEEIAAVPDEEIIKAAEWRAVHPKEPEPQVLTDLNPSTWTTKPGPPPPPKPSKGAATTARDSATPSGMIVVPAPALEHFGSQLLQKINNSSNAVVIAASMEWKPIPQPNPYTDCTHEDAEREAVMSMQSAEPIKYLVRECLRCDRAALARRMEQYLAQLNQILDDHVDVRGDAVAVPADLAKHFQRVQDEAMKCREDLRRIDRRIQDAEPVTWPRSMF